DDGELRRVVPKPPFGGVRPFRVEVPAVDQRLLGPRRDADQDVARCAHRLSPIGPQEGRARRAPVSHPHRSTNRAGSRGSARGIPPPLPARTTQQVTTASLPSSWSGGPG